MFKRIILYKSFHTSCITLAKRLTVKEALTNSSVINENIKVQGWVKCVRRQKRNIFIDVNDGSCHKNLQALSSSDLSADLRLGTSVMMEGTLVASSHPLQPVELAVSSVHVLGTCEAQLYPFKVRAKHPLEYIRGYPHLRARTEAFSSVLRVRNTATIAVHEYFQSNGFIQVHTPLLTSSDCEGAGDLFEVSPVSRSKLDNHFFDVRTHLTVSGQLHAETIACGMSRVYTFGPVFRAERSNSRRHLSEFYMVESEMVTNNESPPLEQIMNVSEDMIKCIVERVLHTNEDDLYNFHSKFSSKNNIKEQLQNILEKSFKRIHYEDAIKLLESVKKKENFEIQPEFGTDLGAEHERYLVQHFDGLPVFVTHFPHSLKPFYARTDDQDTNTSLSMDLLMPNVGEVIGGTVREERYEILQNKLEKLGIEQDYQWYLDLRRFGTMPHGGFGLGFDRLIQVLLGIDNIRDVIPYPRSPTSCQM